MATQNDLVGMGVPVFIARVQGKTPVVEQAFGAAAGSASPIAGDQYLSMVTATTTGSGLLMPQVGGDWAANAGAMLGDEFKIFNALATAIQIYCANNANGSAVTFYINAVSAAGTTGIALLSGQMAILTPFTVSTWVGIRSSA